MMNPPAPTPEILQTATRRLTEELTVDVGGDEPASLSPAEAHAAVALVVATLAAEGGLSLDELNRLQARDRADRRLRALLRDLLTGTRKLHERLLKQRDNTPDHNKALLIERAAGHVPGVADDLERILGIEPGADDGYVLVAKADLVAYLNRGTGDLQTEAEALNRLLAAAGIVNEGL